MKTKTLFSIATVAVAIFTACNQAADEIILPVEQETVVSDNPFAVSIDEAEQTLMEILAQSQKQATRAGVPVKERRIKNRYTSGGNSTITRSADGEEIVVEHPVVHIFNFENNEGFAVMGGDKRGAPMLALTEAGQLTPGMRTDNFGFIASLARAEEVYRQQIIRSRIDTITNGYITVYNYINEIVVNENGQCPVRWGQDIPYNYLCPFDYDHFDFSKTGCVATAVAQLMATYRYPTSYNGYTFDWDEMIADASNVGVARLMQQLGLSNNLNMDYHYTGSSSSSSLIPQTLLNFGYSLGGVYTDYLSSAIMNEVMSEHPVIIRADCTLWKKVTNPLGIVIYLNGDEKGKGHAWLGDGGELMTVTSYIFNSLEGTSSSIGPNTYQYVHCNFGWNDWYINYNCDGLYLTDDNGGYFNLDEIPDTTVTNTYDIYGNHHEYTYDFNYLFNQKMVVNIRP